MAGRPPAVVELACWAHVRRKFYDVHQATRSPMAEDVQKRIGRLYDVGLDRHRPHDAEDLAASTRGPPNPGNAAAPASGWGDRSDRRAPRRPAPSET